MRRFFPIISVAVFGASLALLFSSVIAYRLSIESPSKSPLKAMAFLPSAQQKIWTLGQGLFGDDGPVKEMIEAVVAPAPVVGDRKRLLLLGVLRRGPRSTVIIRDVSADSTALFSLGDFVFGDVEHLARVDHGAVVLNSAGGERVLKLGIIAEAITGAAQSAAASEDALEREGMAISRAEVNASVRSAEELLGTSQIVPEVRKGKIAGFKVQNVQEGSIVQKMGISPGDVIKRVNAYELNSLERSMEVWEKMKKESQIHMLVERDGQEQVMSYYLKP